VYTRVHLYGAQRRATCEKYSSIALHHLDGELNENGATWQLGCAYFGSPKTHICPQDFARQTAMLRDQWEAKIKIGHAKTANHIASYLLRRGLT